MATAYTSILKLALPVQGELSGTWGDVVNNNITSMVEEAIAGRAVINTWTTNSHTLTSADGTTSESRCAMLEFTDTGTALTGDATVVCPTAAKIYICKNDAGQKVTIKTSAGTGVAIADGQTMFVFCDGTNVVEAVTSMSSLKLGTAATSVQVTAVLDEDDLVSDSATALATQQSIKAYVDSQVTAQDLDFGGDSGTGSVDLDSQTFTIAGTSNEIETSASGQTLTVGLPAAVTVTTSVTTPTVQATNIKANDGTAAATIADSTGVVTVASAVLTTADINGGTADNVVIGGTTAAAGSFTTVGATGNITSQGQVITDTINEQTATSGVTVDGVLLKDGGATLTGDLTVDTDTLYVDSTNNRVGIGTSSPAALLHLESAEPVIRIKDSDGAVYHQIFGNTSDLYIDADRGNNASSNIIFRNDATEAMRIDSSGNVGIGTSSPDANLEISDTIDATIRLTSTDNKAVFTPNVDTYGTIEFYSNDVSGAGVGIKSAIRSYVGNVAGGQSELAFTTSDGSSNDNEAMRIDSSGNVGIGTSSPANLLNLYQSDTSSNSYLQINHVDSGTGASNGLSIGLESNGTDAAFRNRESGSVKLYTDNTERMRITSSGNVGIGTSSPAYKLQLSNSADTDLCIIAGKNSGDFASIVFGDTDYPAEGRITYQNSDDAMRFWANRNQAMIIDSSGNVGIGTSSPNIPLEVKGRSSDGRFLRGTDNGGTDFVDIGHSGSLAFIDVTHSGGAYHDLAINTGGTEAMRIDSSGNVGIGVVPKTGGSTWQHVQFGGTGNIIGRISDSTVDAIFASNYYINSSGTDSYIATGDAARMFFNDDVISFSNAGSGSADAAISWNERMRIDSDGNLFVGKTSANLALTGVQATSSGQAFSVTRDGGAPFNLNRLSSDGEIAGFWKDTVKVGSIGTSNSYIYIGEGDVGLAFRGFSDYILPWNPSTNSTRDNAINIGDSAYRFKDIYLSGGVYLGGTGSANKLDDYEEGSWTPAFQNVTVSYTEQYGKYTKIGDTVHLWGYMVISSIDNSDTSYVNIGGMPFTSTGGFVNGSFYNGSGNASLFTTTTLGAAWTIVSQSYFYLGIPSSTNNLSYAQACNASGRIWFAMTYPTAS